MDVAEMFMTRQEKQQDESKQTQHYTVADVEAMPREQRVELIDGILYDMATPSMTHQRIAFLLARRLADFIDEKGGDCEVFPAPFGVYLTENERNLLEPDVIVVCNPDKLDEKGCHGAPDFVAEVVSKSSEQRDYAIKLFKYRTAGVREYWIINPMTRVVNVYRFDLEEEKGLQYSMDEEITSEIFEGFRILF